MNKEQIQQKFKKLLEEKFNLLPNEKGQLFLAQSWIEVGEMITLLEYAFNLGLEVASDNAEADIEILSEQIQHDFQYLQEGQDYEVYCLKESILKFKL